MQAFHILPSFFEVVSLHATADTLSFKDIFKFPGFGPILVCLGSNLRLNVVL